MDAPAVNQGQASTIFSRLTTALAGSVEKLHPAYFAMVMSTGIISIDCKLMGYNRLAFSLFILNIGIYLWLLLLTAARIRFYPEQFFTDLIDHSRGVGFFTLVAASGVLGNQFILIGQNYELSRYLWYLCIGLWLGFTYFIFTSFTVKENKPTLELGINGGWLLAVVATQSVSTLGSLLTQHLKTGQQETVFFSLCMWLCGGMLYIWLIALIFYRYTFFNFSPSDFSPPYWINMGAVSITTLAGTRIISNADAFPFLQELMPFLKGFTMFFWATGTWWIPMLFFLGIWRHFYKRYPFSYDPLYWGLVFPLGMYTACTYHLARVLHLQFLYAIPNYFFYVALSAWVIIFCAFLHNLTQSIIRAVAPVQPLSGSSHPK